MNRSLALLFFLFWAAFTKAQLPVVKAATKAHSGFLYYDSEKANDRTERVYRYTISPPEASCLQLNFHLQAVEFKQDFIRIFQGKGVEGPLMASFGGSSGGKVVQLEGGQLTVEFQRDGLAMGSAWTLFWNSDQKGDCMDEKQVFPECPELKEVCGPLVREGNFDLPFKPGGVSAVDSSCLRGRENRFWYKFMVQHNGRLGFSIQSRNFAEDLDWAIWRADSGATNICPADLLNRQLVACNQASGIGAKGQTGMGHYGTRPFNGAGQSPWSSSLPVEQGEVFFLLVQPPPNSTEPFEINFNKTVLQCETPPRTVFPIAQQVQLPKVNNILRMFSRNSKTIRIDLQEKANLPLRDAPLDLAKLSQISSPKQGQDGEPRPSLSGLPGLLLWGLQTGRFEALPPMVSSTPLHYGDILDMVYRTHGAIPQLYWTPDPGLMAPMGEVIDLQIEEIGEAQSSRLIQRIHSIRMVWFDPLNDIPGFYVAHFPFSQIRPFLEIIEVSNPRNEASSLSLADILDQKLYHSFTLKQRNRRLRNLAEGQRQDERRMEFESYKWSH